MSENFKDKYQQVFGDRSLVSGLFYEWPIGIRFELAEGSGIGSKAYKYYTQRVYQSLYRSKQLIEYIFKDSKNIFIQIKLFKGHKAQIKRLEKCGFLLPEKYELVREIYDTREEKEDQFYIHKISFSDSLKSPNIHALLWAVMTNEMGVTPTANIDVWFINFEKEIVAHPYDDRGMDIVANNTQALLSCYKDFNEWILDYDRKKIDAIFNV